MIFFNDNDTGKYTISDTKMLQKIYHDSNDDDVKQAGNSNNSLGVTQETIDTDFFTENSSQMSKPALNKEVLVLHQVFNKTHRPPIVPAAKLVPILFAHICTGLGRP